MRTRLCISKVASLLLILVVCGTAAFLSHRETSLFPADSPSPSSSLPTFSADLDGDGRADHDRFESGEWQNSIELELSRSEEPSTLHFSPLQGKSGSLLVLDIDHDGDLDLLWRGSSQATEVIVWLNDGSGRFEFLCPPHIPDSGVTFDGSGISTPSKRRAENALCSEQDPVPGLLCIHRGIVPLATRNTQQRREQIWTPTSLHRLPTERGPPCVRC